MADTGLNKTFCSLPWVSVAVDPDGSCKPCCISSDFIRKADGTKYNLGKDQLDTIFNSPDYVKIRENMLDGKPVAGCTRCYQMEQLGGKSHRESYNEGFPVTDPLPNTTPQIQYFDLRFGNLCNLNCRSCSPKNSSQLAKEIRSLPDQSIISKYQILVAPSEYDWYESSVYEENMRSQYTNIRMLYMTGGEPTIIQQNIDTMTKLVELGLSSRIVLKINSNMTNINPKFYDMLSKFRSVIFFASVDGYGVMQEYLRYPSKWKQIDQNLRTLLDIGTVQIRPTPVVQLTNLNCITDLFEYFEAQNTRVGRCVYELHPIILESPPHLNLSHLPREFTIKSWDRIEAWLDTCRYQPPAFLRTMQALKTKCYTASEDNEQLQAYVEYNGVFDTNRGVSLSDVNPELHGLLSQIK